LEALVSVCWWRFWDRSGVRLVECLVPVVWCFLGDLASFYELWRKLGDDEVRKVA
jgi:hypothetical protein